jgi:hypothetical protein
MPMLAGKISVLKYFFLTALGTVYTVYIFIGNILSRLRKQGGTIIQLHIIKLFTFVKFK